MLNKKMISYLFQCVQVPDFERNKITKWINVVAADYNKKVGQINYIFCSDERILEVNNQYLQHDYYTDIITFDYAQGNIISGDVFISIDTVKSNAVERNIDFLDELMRIIIHGVLHLCGQDDKTPLLREEMTQKEDKALGKLR